MKVEAVVKFQSQIGTKADGIWGKNTTRQAVKYFNLTPVTGAHFFGQLAVESANFTAFTENLNYSKSGLLTVFPKYFTNSLAEKYARKPQQIANRVYANRMGNGNEASGDGWKYRGRGAIQLTGKNNYRAFGKWLGKEEEILSNPDLVSTEYAFQSAFWYFTTNDLWTIAARGMTEPVVRQLTKAINGGTNGYLDRKNKTFNYYEFLK